MTNINDTETRPVSGKLNSIESDTQSAAEWEAYKRDPSPTTLNALVRSLRQNQREETLLPGLRAIFAETKQWKTAQHLAMVFEQEGYPTHALYFAGQASSLSGGDPFARIIVARILWLRRLPSAMFYELPIIRSLARRIKNRVRRRLLQKEIAELNVMAHSYLRDPTGARPWVTHLRRARGVSVDAWIQLLFGARSASAADLHEIAALTLAPFNDRVGTRVQAAIRTGVYSALFRMILTR